MLVEPLEQVRQLELMRLDRLLLAIPKAISGDLAAIDRCLAIGARRARLLGLDIVPARPWEDDPPPLRVEIINDPEATRKTPPPPNGIFH